MPCSIVGHQEPLYLLVEILIAGEHFVHLQVGEGGSIVILQPFSDCRLLITSIIKTNSKDEIMNIDTWIHRRHWLGISWFQGWWGRGTHKGHSPSSSPGWSPSPPLPWSLPSLHCPPPHMFAASMQASSCTPLLLIHHALARGSAHTTSRHQFLRDSSELTSQNASFLNQSKKKHTTTNAIICTMSIWPLWGDSGDHGTNA